jgi:alpha-amylase
MHKVMIALSDLARRRGDPPEARRALGRAQCNDAYWHGVFGGLYLPHLRHAIWHQLAVAERALRQGEAIACEELDLDYDGHNELWIHSANFSALVSPQRGGAIEMLTRFDTLVNLADVLTRRRESYHEPPKGHEHGSGDSEGADGAPSIHDIEKAAQLKVLPPIDAAPRAILVDRVLHAGLSFDDYVKAKYTPVRSWATTPLTARISVEPDSVTLALEGEDLTKRLTFDSRGCVDVAYMWNAGAFGDGVFAPELSLARDISLRLRPETEAWRFAITTTARSERGFEETEQGISITPRWAAHLGHGELEIAT